MSPSLWLAMMLAAAAPSNPELEPARDALRRHEYAHAAELLAALSENGNAEATYQLALLYLPRSHDVGMTADAPRACALLIAAANGGWAKASYTLASQVESGVCVNTGHTAEEWSTSAEKGGFKPHAATIEASAPVEIKDPATLLRRAAQEGDLAKLASLLTKFPAIGQ